MNFPKLPGNRADVLAAVVALSGLVAIGCGAETPANARANETPAEAAARVLAMAQGLEKAGKTRQAFAAYHQIVQQFPDSTAARTAAAQIQRAHRQAAIKVRRAVASRSRLDRGR